MSDTQTRELTTGQEENWTEAQLWAEIHRLRAALATVHAGSRAAQDVLAERVRQVTKEGWLPEHDDKYMGNELAHAAACYAYPELTCVTGLRAWPWAPEWWKPRDPRSNFVRAGGLILAAIERWDRLYPSATYPSKEKP